MMDSEYSSTLKFIETVPGFSHRCGAVVCLGSRCRRFMATLVAVLTLTFSVTGPARSTDLDGLADLSAAQFETLIENIGAATHYKSVSPAEPLGLIGFDVALGISLTDIDSTLLSLASQDSIDSGSLPLVRASVHKGLPFGFDVGASLAVLPGTDFRVIGAELRYALLRGSVLTPAVAIRGSYSVVTGSDELDIDNAGLELSISKGFLLLTPYAGIGVVRSNGDPSDGFGLSETDVNQEKLFAGVNLKLGFNLAFEVDRTGDHTSATAKAGFRF